MAISNFEGLVTLTLTLDRVILHTVVYHSSTSTYIPNFIEIEETFCGRTDVRTHVSTHVRTDKRMDIWDRLFRSTLVSKSQPKIAPCCGRSRSTQVSPQTVSRWVQSYFAGLTNMTNVTNRQTDTQANHVSNRPHVAIAVTRPNMSLETAVQHDYCIALNTRISHMRVCVTYCKACNH